MLNALRTGPATPAALSASTTVSTSLTTANVPSAPAPIRDATANCSACSKSGERGG